MSDKSTSDKSDKAAAAASRAADPEHRALVDAYKAAGKLPETHRYEWELPKALRVGGGRKSKRRDAQARKDLVDDTPVEPVWVETAVTEIEPVRGGRASGLVVVPDDTNYALPVAELVTDDAGVQGDAGGGDVVAEIADDPDSIAWNKSELRRLLQKKRDVSDELFALGTGDKEALALCKQKLSLIESQEKSCRDALNLFNKKRLDAESTANQVLIIIEPWQGDGTNSVKTWL